MSETVEEAKVLQFSRLKMAERGCLKPLTHTCSKSIATRCHSATLTQ